MGLLTGIDTILVQTTDMDRATAFYRDLLELKIGIQSPYWTDFELGNARIGLHPPFAGVEPTLAPNANALIGVATRDIVRLRSKLELAGDFVRGAFHQTPGGVVLDFVDPDGTQWQAIQLGSQLSDLL